MAGRKAFLLRLDPRLLEALQKWAADDLRSLNAQIDYLLRCSVKKAGRKIVPGSVDPDNEEEKEPSKPA